MKLTSRPLDIVIIGPSILASHANSTAELYRGLINELAQHGHRTVFLEPYHPATERRRDMLRSPYCEVWVYRSTEQLLSEYLPAIQSADAVMLGNGIPDTDRIAEWIANEARGITIYYDTNLARTDAHLRAGDTPTDCLSCRTVANFSLFLSTTGGPTLERVARQNHIRRARPLYESIDPYSYYRTDADKSYDLGFIGNYKADRTKLLEQLLLRPAEHTPNRQFALAGGGYPAGTVWPQNLTYLEHLPATNHVDYYNRQRATLVVSRSDRRRMGYTPSRRLLEAAACGVPLLSDDWAGLGEFFEPGREVFTVGSEHDVLDVLYGTEDDLRRRCGAAARARVLAEHTTGHRARQLLTYWGELVD